ncbi:MAG: FliI/YscN family ATPase [Phycisphaerales bacterium JB065]
MTVLEAAISRVSRMDPVRVEGRVGAVQGLTVLVDDFPVVIGALVAVVAAGGERLGEVIGFDGRRAIVMMLGQTNGIRPGDRVRSEQTQPTVDVGESMLGRVVNGLCEPIDHGPGLHDLHPQPLYPDPIGAMARSRVSQPLPTGVRAIDLMTTLGRGQRLGIFAGPGVGKSTLLGMIARGTIGGDHGADVNVIGLIGERGREVRDFIEQSLGDEGMRRTVVVVSTSDESPLMRVRAANAACAVAEFFRDSGRDVMLMIDSITRLAHAQRQIGLAVGEPPATRGYTPSVFATLPVLLERAGSVRTEDGQNRGSITGLYTTLVEGDDMTEPVADAVRGILDGHVILSRSLAQKGYFPAVDVLDSVSRVASEICSREHIDARQKVASALAAYRDVEELLQIGAYTPGANPLTDAAVSLKDRMDGVLTQPTDALYSFEESVETLCTLAKEIDILVENGRNRAGQQRAQIAGKRGG